MRDREECGLKEAFFLREETAVCLCAYGKDPVEKAEMMIQKSGEKFQKQSS